LIAIVDDIGRTGRLLEYAELELATAGKVRRLVGCNGLELSGANGVVDCDLAGRNLLVLCSLQYA